MKTKLLLTTLLLALILAACAPAAPAMEEPTTPPASTPEPALPTEAPAELPTQEVPAGKVPALPVESITYSDEDFGLLVDFPADWTIGEKMVLGERASQTQVTSPDGANSASITVYNWDPKNDLAAYADHRKQAWDASGFTVLSEDEWVQDNGQSVMVYTIKTADDKQALFAFAAAGDRYIEFSGEGDLALLEQIVLTLRFVQ
jgi:hypothetical protein